MKNQEHSLIVLLGFVLFNDGLAQTQSLALNYIYKEEFGVEPAQLAIYSSIIISPLCFRLFIGTTIDSNIMPRKAYAILGNAIPGLIFTSIAMEVINGPKTICAALFTSTFIDQFLEAVTSAYIL